MMNSSQLNACPSCSQQVLSVDLVESGFQAVLSCLTCGYYVKHPVHLLNGFDVNVWQDVETRDQMFPYLKPLFELWNRNTLLQGKQEKKGEGGRYYFLGFIAGAGFHHKPNSPYGTVHDSLHWLDGWIDGSLFKEE